jgi:hypothetical protein
MYHLKVTSFALSPRALALNGLNWGSIVAFFATAPG